MHKFKAGDRVRIIDDAGGGKVGDVYTVDRFDAYSEYGAYYQLRDGPGGIHGLYEKRLELVPSFKVGDRVRLTNKDRARSGSVGVVITAKNDKNYVDVDFEAPFDGWGESGHCWCCSNDELELVTPTLTIEAGKFYRTRDGRKVGPMREPGYATNYAFAGELNGEIVKIFQPDGTHGSKWVQNKPDFDLVAEWAEDVFAPLTPISNDNAPKFKVGDRVEVVAASTVAKNSYIGTFFTIDSNEGELDGEQSWAGKDHSPYRYKESELRLVAPATSGKFKVGDRVARPGHLNGTIVGIDGDRVRVDYGGHWGIWTWSLNEIDHYPQQAAAILPACTTKQAIVCLIENNQPKPSGYPHVHASTADAAKEAERLAGKFRGQEFGIYELVSTVQKERVYEHEWQRLAARGDKILSIKELRAKTGITLKGAKDAVEHWLQFEVAA